MSGNASNCVSRPTATGVECFAAALDKSGNNALAPQRIDKMMRAPHQERRLWEITPPRIAPFVKHGNDFRDRVLFWGLKVRSLRAFWRCPMRPGKINSRGV